MHKKGFSPIIDDNTEILILGSLPGDISLIKNQYYANLGNDFWKIMGLVLNEEIPNEYDKKLQILRKNKIGLWDVYHSGKRTGSLDMNIENQKLNDFTSMKKKYPKINLICFNGKKAGKAENLIKNFGFKTKVLPSSSGANRRDQKQRIKEWSSILK